MKTYQVTVAPSVEPVTLETVKAYLRVDFTDDDTEIQNNITLARQWLEAKTGKSLVTQTIQMVTTLYDEVVSAPVSNLIGEGTRLAVELTPSPAQAVSLVEFETKTNTWQTLVADTDYIFDNPGGDASAWLYLADYVLSYWTGTFTGIGVYPVERRGPRLRVTYTAGYGDAGTDAPSSLTQAVTRAAAWLYDNRGCPLPDGLLPSDFMPWRL